MSERLKMLVASKPNLTMILSMRASVRPALEVVDNKPKHLSSRDRLSLVGGMLLVYRALENPDTSVDPGETTLGETPGAVSWGMRFLSDVELHNNTDVKVDCGSSYFLIKPLTDKGQEQVRELKLFIEQECGLNGAANRPNIQALRQALKVLSDTIPPDTHSMAYQAALGVIPENFPEVKPQHASLYALALQGYAKRLKTNVGMGKDGLESARNGAMRESDPLIDMKVLDAVFNTYRRISQV